MTLSVSILTIRRRTPRTKTRSLDAIKAIDGARASTLIKSYILSIRAIEERVVECNCYITELQK